MRIIIVGGGIAGLSMAIALKHKGFNVKVFEASPEMKVAGAGIWMATNAMLVFDKLNIVNDIEQAGATLKSVQITDQHLNKLQATDEEKIREIFGFGITSIHRATLRQILLDHTGIEKVSAGKKLIYYKEKDDSVEVIFEDGTSESGDILIGADGIQSNVRNQLFPNSQLRYSGQTCWRGVANYTPAPPHDKSCVEAWGDQIRFGLSVISENNTYWFAVKKAPFGQQDQGPVKSKLLNLYGDFDPLIRNIIEATPEHKIIRNDISDLKPIKKWYSDRVCLIGDAAHATTPNMGQGGCQAVEDAWYLSQYLSTYEQPKKAFKAFQNSRQARVNFIVKNSWIIGKIAHISFGQGLRNFIFKNIPEKIIMKNVEKLFTIKEP